MTQLNDKQIKYTKHEKEITLIKELFFLLKNLTTLYPDYNKYINDIQSLESVVVKQIAKFLADEYNYDDSWKYITLLIKITSDHINKVNKHYNNMFPEVTNTSWSLLTHCINNDELEYFYDKDAYEIKYDARNEKLEKDIEACLALAKKADETLRSRINDK